MKFFWSVVAGVVSGALGLVLGRAAYERYFEKISTKALPPSKAPVELPTSREEMEDLRGFVDDCMLELNLTIEGDVPIDDDDAEDAIEDLRLCVLDKPSILAWFYRSFQRIYGVLQRMRGPLRRSSCHLDHLLSLQKLLF